VAAWALAVLVAMSVARKALHAAGVAPLTAATQAVLALLIVLVSLALWRFFDGRPPRETPLALDRHALRALGAGLAVGVALVVVVTLALAATGSYRVSMRACTLGDQGAFLASSFLLFFFAALVEELLFRGYPLFAVRDGVGFLSAIAASSLLFALAHAGNPNFGWEAMAGVAWIGVVLAVWVLATGTLWGAVGAHVGWNAALVAGAAIPVSGLSFRTPCHEAAVEGPAWLTGGGFGVEAGLVAAVAWGAVGAVVLARGRGSPR
jgi:membrane protease YdiL (CAAX protease family)